MDATELSAIVTLTLTLIKTAKYRAQRQKRFASTHPQFRARIAQKGRSGLGPPVSDFAKKHSSLTFFFKSIGDGCNGYECDCNYVDNVTKIGKLSCESSEAGCETEEGYTGTTSEFPFFTNPVLCIFFS